MSTASFRQPTRSDVPRLGRACFEAFGAVNAKHGFPNDMPSVEMATGLMGMVVESPFIEGVVAERDGEPFASAFLWPDGPVAGIGPVTVDPTAQDASVGRGMIEWIVARGDELGLKSQRLVQAAFHSRSLVLYTKLGFDVKEPLAVITGQPRQEGIPGQTVRPMTEADLEAANALCTKIHGHARAGELAGATQRGEAKACFAEDRLTGYTTGVGFFGHAVGKTNEDLKALIDAAEAITGPGMLVPTRNADLFRWCLQSGFRIVYPATLMARGWYQEPKGAFLPSILY